MNEHTKNSDILNDEQVAGLLFVDQRTLRKWRRERGLPHVKLTAKVILYRRADLDKWLSQHVVGGVS
jgi:excisionase family DNA binding protein